MILAVDGGIATLGWAIVHPKQGSVHALGVIIQPNDPGVEDTTCRARRAHRQAQELYALVNEHGVTTIAAEAVSLGGPPKSRLGKAQSLNLCWGVVTAIAAITLCELVEVRPKQWQHAITGETGPVDYDRVFADLSDFLNGTPVEQLMGIIKSERNHAIDACGVGIYTALRPEATRIARRPS